MASGNIRKVILSELIDDDGDLNKILLLNDECAQRALAHVVSGHHDRISTVKIYGYAEEVVPTYNPGQFREHFRMRPEVFESLCAEVCPHLTPMRTIGVEKRVLATVWLLANPESYRSVADRFGFNKGQLHDIVLSVCHILTEKCSSHIKWPESGSYPRIAQEWKKRANFPGVIGAVDGTYIPIPGPCSNNRDAYICRKGFPAMQLQVVCDQSMKFIDVQVGNVGSVHDARVWRTSDLHQYLQGEGSLPDEFHIIGDSAYPNSNCLLVPFRDNGHLTTVQKKYNVCHSKTRVTVEHSIGLLKSKFRRLKYLAMTNYTEVPIVIFACCVLHNFILESNDIDENEIVLSDIDEDLAANDLLQPTDGNSGDTKRRNIASTY